MHDSDLPDIHARLARRAFLGTSATAASLGGLAALLGRDGLAAPVLTAPHVPPRAKRIIYLFQSGGPSHLELLDPKPGLGMLHGTDLPESVRKSQRINQFTANQGTFPVMASKYKFKPCGQSGIEMSELLPHTGRIVDRLCVVRSLYTEAVNHDPAITFIQTGSQQPGRASLGAWLSYGLGSEAEDLPSFVVMLSQGSGNDSNQGLLERLWGAGFLASSHQGVKLRSGGDPVLYLKDPAGVSRQLRRSMLDGLGQLHDLQFRRDGDPEIASRIRQYEMAFRMQASVPELTDLSQESARTVDRYGPEARKPGTFAANCLLARRLVERGVRCVQLFHRGWDEHSNLVSNIQKQCHDIDQPQAALVEDLAERGLLDDTLVVWGGEFGRTVFAQGKVVDDFGRDHHGGCFSMWLAGGGVKAGIVHGQTDDFGFRVVKDPVHVHDLNATLLHCLGIDHERLTYRFQGRDYRLTDVAGKVVAEILA